MDSPSAPEGYDPEKNLLYQQMQTYKSMLVLLRDGSHISLYCQGPPGCGKTRLAQNVLGSRVREAKANANNIVDVLQENRNAKRILLWDDANFVWNSTGTLNILNSAIDPGAGRRWIVDQKTRPHRRFAYDGKNVFLTNKDMLDTDNLKGFSATATDIIPVINRFHLKSRMTFDPLHLFHYACWWGTDGGHMLRDLTDTKTGKHLTREECNEVLAWFAKNYPKLADPSPRNLQIVGEHRLWAPTIWTALSSDLLSETTLKTDKGVLTERQVQEPWVIPDTGKMPHRLKKHQLPDALNHYRILGVKPDATLKEITAAYKRESKRHHPDVTNKNTGNQIKRVNEAYATLKDAEKRAAYDLENPYKPI